MQFKAQRDKLPGPFPGLCGRLAVWDVWHGHSGMGVISCEGVWKMLPQQNWGPANKEGKNGYWQGNWP